MLSEEIIQNLSCIRSYLRIEGVTDKSLFDAIDSAIDAIDQQRPKKPEKAYGLFWTCPVCDEEVVHNLTDGGGWDYQCGYCPNCGQAIDWGDDDDT